jgi:predicted transcriptional regulator of viral defense system
MNNSKVYTAFSSKGIFTYDEFNKKFKNSKHSSRVLLHYLVKNKILGTIKRELYFTIPSGSPVDYSPEPILIGSKLSPQNYYLGYHSALEVHGVAYSKYESVYVNASNGFKKFNFKGITFYNITPVKHDYKTGIETRIYSNNTIKISDRERTIIDCLDRISLAGGVEEFLKSVKMFPSVNPGKIYKYLVKIGKKNLFNKVGWMLDLFRINWGIKKSFLDKIENNLSEHVVYLDKSKSKYNKKWKIMIPENINQLLSED